MTLYFRATSQTMSEIEVIQAASTMTLYFRATSQTPNSKRIHLAYDCTMTLYFRATSQTSGV